ncbi:thioredoxin domain-containing protein, partial [Prolixibacteraceae bacterium]|nr:thioredoxin domain-containing protein [Prolixibacteraceae bacterium]
MGTKTILLNREEFINRVMDFTKNMEWRYKGNKPCIIDFYADWCGPCKAISPILEELAAAYHEDIFIYKVDTEKEIELSALFGIQSIPSLLFVPLDGK